MNLKLSIFNSQFKLYYCVFSNVFFLAFKSISFQLEANLTVQLLPVLCKTFLKTPENMQKDKWYVEQLRTVVVVLYFSIFLKQFHPYQGCMEQFWGYYTPGC